MLHSGHVAFLKEASQLGDVYACIGNDENIKKLKGRFPVISQTERKYMLESLSCIKECRINKGEGIMDFENEFKEINPDIFVVNEDGAERGTPRKRRNNPAPQPFAPQRASVDASASRLVMSDFSASRDRTQHCRVSARTKSRRP